MHEGKLGSTDEGRKLMEIHRVTISGQRYALRVERTAGISNRAKRVRRAKEDIGFASDPAMPADHSTEAVWGAGGDLQTAMLAFLRPLFVEPEQWRTFVNTDPGLFELARFCRGVEQLYDLQGSLGPWPEVSDART